MDSFQGDAADSRTAEVGRKRDLAEFTLPQHAASDYADDLVERILKRAKTDTVVGHESAAGWVAVNRPSPSLDNPPPTQMPQFPSTEQQTTTAPPLMVWNKSVQGGVRTSFGSKAPSLTRPPAPIYNHERDSTSRGSMDTNHQAHVIADAPRVSLDLGLNSNPQEVVGTNVPADTAAGNTVSPRPNGKKPRKKKIPASKSDVIQAKATSEHNPTPNLAPHAPKEPQLPRSLPASDDKVYKNGAGVFALDEVFKNNHPITLEELTINDFIPHFLRINAEKLNLLKGKTIKKAFSTYINIYYEHLPVAVRNRARDILLAQCRPTIWVSGLNKAKNKANAPEQRVESDKRPESPGEAGGSLEGRRYGLRNASENGVSGASRPPGGVLSAADADRPPSNADGKDFAPLASPELERENREMPSVDAAFDAVLDDLEIELLQKYFPTVPGSVASPKCLACASSVHKTFDCPALTCTLCGGNHSVFTCPKNQRCGKCRVKGHQTAECPEKLSLAASEAGGCDLCHSRDHLESACHWIWRSFTPRPEEIRTVRDIPVYCYVCGAVNHYGPECGLHHGKILSGGLTWSKSNLQKYLDPSSSDRAIAAGKDYSLPNLPKKGLSIKGQGQASDPITLDDSDDETDFIRPSVKHFSQQGGTSQHIHFAQSRISGQEPPARSLSYREPNLPRQTQSNFGSNTGFQGSARYGRERSFSPPPRYNDFHAGFNENARYLPQGPSRRGYQPADEGQHNGRRPVPGVNSSRGSQSGRGRGAPARGASNARGKKRGRGGK